MTKVGRSDPQAQLDRLKADTDKHLPDAKELARAKDEAKTATNVARGRAVASQFVDVRDDVSRPGEDWSAGKRDFLLKAARADILESIDDHFGAKGTKTLGGIVDAMSQKGAEVDIFTALSLAALASQDDVFGPAAIEGGLANRLGLSSKDAGRLAEVLLDVGSAAVDARAELAEAKKREFGAVVTEYAREFIQGAQKAIDGGSVDDIEGLKFRFGMFEREIDKRGLKPVLDGPDSAYAQGEDVYNGLFYWQAMRGVISAIEKARA